NALGPGLHPGCHAAPEKQRTPQALASISRTSGGLAPQLLVLLDQMLVGHAFARRFLQRRFFWCRSKRRSTVRGCTLVAKRASLTYSGSFGVPVSPPLLNCFAFCFLSSSLFRWAVISGS